MTSEGATIGSRRAKVFVVAVAVAFLVVAVVVVPHLISAGSGSPDGPQLTTAAIRSFPVVASASGVAVPASEVEVNFVNPGQLIEVDVQVGMTVAKGAVLARIDPSVAETDVSQAQAELAAAKAAPINGTDFLDGQAQIAAAADELQRAQDELAETTLTAPIDGTVLELNGQVGEIVNGAATAAPTLPGTTASVPEIAGVGNSSGAATTSPQDLPFIVVGNPGSLVVGAAFTATQAMGDRKSVV